MKLHFKGVPLSVNKAYLCKGVRRIKTSAYRQYEKDIESQLFLQKKEIHPFPPKTSLHISYYWYLTNDINSDYDNPIKPLQDLLVKYGVIDDDRYIRGAKIMKHKSTVNHFEIEIKEIIWLKE